MERLTEEEQEAAVVAWLTKIDHDDAVAFAKERLADPVYKVNEDLRITNAFRALLHLHAKLAAAPSAEDIEALRDAMASVKGSPHPGMTPRERTRALATLTKLIGGG